MMKQGDAWPKTVKEFCLAGQVFALVLVLRILIRWVKLTKLLGLLTTSNVPPSSDRATFQKLVGYVNGVLRRFPTNPRGDCLARSLTLYFFGIRYGLPLQFHCGIRQAESALKGHAWLSLHGNPLLEHDNPFDSHAVMFSFPPQTPDRVDVIDDSEPPLGPKSNS